MKKITSLALALALALTLTACGKKDNTAGSGDSSIPADATALLTAVWDAHSDDEKFPAAGGDYENPVEDAPGAVSIADADNLNYMLTLPVEDAGKIDGAASLSHMMNANPFTLGHRHLVERAARENDVIHLFVLSEEAGPIPSAVRRELVEQGVRDLPNVFCHATGPYLISSATFPSYFLKDSDTVIRTQAELDLRIFCQIARRLGIQRRYVGQERSSHVTRLYNEVMCQKLPEAGIQCVEIPRLTRDGAAVSASAVRQAIHDGQPERIRDWVPASTYDFFTGPRGASVCAAIQREAEVIHY